MLKQENDAFEMYHRQPNLGMIFMPNQDATIVLQSGEEALNLLSVPVATQGTSILGLGSVLPVRSD